MACGLLRVDGVGTIVTGTFYCKKSDTNSRELDVEIHYSSRQNAGTTERLVAKATVIVKS
jgi:hypothetical protein